MPDTEAEKDDVTTNSEDVDEVENDSDGSNDDSDDTDEIADEEVLSKEQLAQKTKDFETEAMPFINLLHNYAYRMTGNQLDADDLVQETYLRAFRFFHKFEKGTNCKAWLFRIMKNLFINKYRKNQKEPGKVDYNDVENFFDSIKSDRIESTDLQEKLFSNLLDDDMVNALNSLPDDFKTVVILCDIEGLSYEEIAEFVQCPIGTVRSRLHRGRKLLQQKLLGYAKDKGYDVTKALKE
jgi:RNA polymerase sigma-70 factor (ECF subfamily)